MLFGEISRISSARARDLVGWYLLDQINSLLEVHAEVNKCPLNALALVFLLLEDEHVVVEKLLQLLVGKVDAQLFEAVELLDRVAQRSGRGPMRTRDLSEEQRKKKQVGTAVINAAWWRESRTIRSMTSTRNSHRSIPGRRRKEGVTRVKGVSTGCTWCALGDLVSNVRQTQKFLENM